MIVSNLDGLVKKQRVSECSRTSRSGLTMLELAVSLAIVGILIAILVPVVQQTRAVSRRASCSNNMHQIGIGLHSFHDVKGQFPGVFYVRELLPYLEIGIGASAFDPSTGWDFRTLEQVAESKVFPINSIPTYICPSDPAQQLAKGLVPSYRMNQGTGYEKNEDGFWKRPDGTSTRDFSDGLSQTAAFAERLLYRGTFWSEIPEGPLDPTPDQKRRRCAQVDGFFLKSEIDMLADACEHDAVWFGGQAGHLCTPVSGGCSYHDYNHIMTPNKNSCYTGFPTLEFPADSYSAMTTSSLHTGGVNVLFADGSVHFISDSIDRNPWRALGTRTGNDLVSGLDF